MLNLIRSLLANTNGVGSKQETTVQPKAKKGPSTYQRALAVHIHFATNVGALNARR